MESKLVRVQRRKEAKGNTVRRERSLEPIPTVEGEISAGLLRSTGEFMRNLLFVLVYPARTAEGVIDAARRDTRVARSAYAIMLAGGIMGALLFLIFGGHKYFNPWYILLQPLIASVGSFLVIYMIDIGLGIVWKRADRISIREYTSAIIFISVIIVHAGWLLYPLRYYFLEYLGKPIFQLAVPVYFYTGIRFFGTLHRHFHIKWIATGYFGFSSVLLSFYYYADLISEKIVYIMKL